MWQEGERIRPAKVRASEPGRRKKKHNKEREQRKQNKTKKKYYQQPGTHTHTHKSVHTKHVVIV